MISDINPHERFILPHKGILTHKLRTVESISFGPIFNWVLGIQPQVLCSLVKNFIDGDISLAQLCSLLSSHY